MSNKFDTRNRWLRHRRVRKKVKGLSDRPRLSVFRSSKHIYAQLINDELGSTIASASSLSLDSIEDKKTLIAAQVGAVIAENAKKIGVKEVVFDRGGYKYHGRVKALAESARDGGLIF
ncbi:MAG: 50S ribosomal protein L18 [SAR202 cluster bacterium]|nr:50S ribosomal protein L18 [Chloroflexota bacterium]MDP6425445.1 50S ribosomal protein L18 [Dehalococcoidia bacterium]MDP7232157.1 50S ribosomal protein L18 [Dehalococcoidia bacterium]MDP7613372.1 50S ribosomal protein L18 [Dehalococcoidia bacterium]MQG47020.1 50S ribosomal protein L18 [SAR202 cluster bacterium]